MAEVYSAARIVYLPAGSRIVLDRHGRVLAHFGLHEVQRRTWPQNLRPRISDSARRMVRFWAALLAAAVCADLAKLGFVLVWAETTNRLTWPAWLSDEVRVMSLMALYIGGVVGMIWLLNRACALLKRGGHDDMNLGPLPDSPPGEGPPPPPRRCGVPRLPRRPGPLAAHARPSQATAARRHALAPL